MESRLTLALLLLLVGVTAFEDASTSVPTTTGILRGSRSTVLKKPLTRFLGVPYAVPPVGEFRFRPPVELRSEGIAKEATRFAPSCYQPPHLASVMSPLLKPNVAEISEDCLYLNLYVPDTKKQQQLPVMVWLPGEGFDYADPQQFDGSYLAVQGQVIVVTVNYRLSVFGFMSALSDEAPGNVGLLDQRMALKWIQKNVANFGGDPDNVTLFGRFTGAMSTAIHAFSPLSKKEKLFNRVILQSGVPVGDWVFDRNPLNATLQLAQRTDCLFSELSDVITCLRRLPSDILLSSAMSVPQKFRPVYDYHLIFENTLRAAAKSDYEPIDVMIGFNNNEGSLCTIVLNAMRSPLYEKILKQTLSEADFKQLVSSNMLEIYKESDSLSDKLASYEYLTEDKKSKLREMFVDFCGDIYVTSHAQKLADILSQKSNRVYLYEFAHRPSFSIHPSFIKAGHGDDVLFTLGLPFQLPNLKEDEARLTRKTVEAISTFARKGNPNRDNASDPWPLYTVSNRQLMTFTTFRDDREAVQKSSHEDAVEFWYDIIPSVQHKACPISPSSEDFPLQVEAYFGKGKAYFLGSFITVSTAEYLLLGLFCATGFLLATTVLSLTILMKMKRHAAFQRLR